jgi:hypothetical protein
MSSSRRFPLQIFAGLALLAIGYSGGRFAIPVRQASRLTFAEPLKSPSPSSGTVGISSGLGGDWDAQWVELNAKPRSPMADEATEAALEKLARNDPARALALVLKERNRGRRTAWLHAVLRGWAAVAPGAAAAWISTLPSIEREGAESAVMEGAIHNSAAAIALARQLVQSDPADARSHANQLLRVLSHCGEYEAGVDFAVNLPAHIRSEMLGTAFQYWALSQPERAFDVALKLPEGDTRKTALDAAISGWSQGDPSGLAEFALNLSSATDRAEALQTALREWVQVNPKAASEWIDKFDPKPELDAGAAAVALEPGVLAKRPEIAASWAESITDPMLRSNTLANVLRGWAGKDSAAALNYAKASTALQPTDRDTLLAELSSAKTLP